MGESRHWQIKIGIALIGIALIGIATLWPLVPAAAMASTRSFGGTIESIGPINEDAMPDRRPPFGDAVYTLTLDDPQQRVRSMTLHLPTRDNGFTDAIAYVPGTGALPVDVSDLRLEGPQIRGPLVVRMPAHAAGLGDAQPLAVRINLAVKAVADAHVGEFSGVWKAASNDTPGAP